MAPWASRRRHELLELLDRMNPTIEELTAAAEQEARKRPEVLRLMTHPCVGPLTALAYVLMRRHKSIAKVAMGRRLGVRLYWMWRNRCEYSPSLEFGSYAGQLGTGHGVK